MGNFANRSSGAIPAGFRSWRAPICFGLHRLEPALSTGASPRARRLLCGTHRPTGRLPWPAPSADAPSRGPSASDSTLVMEIAIGEAHARDRAAERAIVGLFEVEAGLERHSLQRGAHVSGRGYGAYCRAGGHGLADLSPRTGPTRQPQVIKDTACAAGTVETGKGETLPAQTARLVGVHLPPGRPANALRRDTPNTIRANMQLLQLTSAGTRPV